MRAFVSGTRWLIVLASLLAHRALAAPACDARTPQEMRNVFSVAMGLDEAVRRANAEVATPEYLELRTRLADYDARRTLPCAAAAAAWLTTHSSEDPAEAALADALLGLASSRRGAESTTLPRSLARFLDARPEVFSRRLAKMRGEDRCVVVESLEMDGAGTMRPGDAGVAHARAVANLRRVYCHAGAKPVRESPANRARERMNPDRPSRPRWA